MLVIRSIFFCLFCILSSNFEAEGKVIPKSDLAAPGGKNLLSKEENKPFSDKTSSKREIKIDLEGPLPTFNHEILLGIEKAYPKGFASPMEAWEVLGLYAQQGGPHWLIGICLSPYDGRWRLVSLGRSDEKWQMRASYHNFSVLIGKLETRITLVRTIAHLKFTHDDAVEIKRNILLNKVPAPFCPPDLADILNQMKGLLLEDYGQEKNTRQLETGYFLTPAGIFSVNISRESKIYKLLCKKKYKKIEQAIDGMYQLPESMYPFVSKLRKLTAHELSGWYSQKAWNQFLIGKPEKLQKEYAQKKIFMGQYKSDLKKYGINVTFVPLHSQEKFWNGW